MYCSLQFLASIDHSNWNLAEIKTELNLWWATSSFAENTKHTLTLQLNNLKVWFISNSVFPSVSRLKLIKRKKNIPSHKKSYSELTTVCQHGNVSNCNCANNGVLHRNFKNSKEVKHEVIFFQGPSTASPVRDENVITMTEESHKNSKAAEKTLHDTKMRLLPPFS